VTSEGTTKNFFNNIHRYHGLSLNINYEKRNVLQLGLRLGFNIIVMTICNLEYFYNLNAIGQITKVGMAQLTIYVTRSTMLQLNHYNYCAITL
jgi:hypothetical protein